MKTETVICDIEKNILIFATASNELVIDLIEKKHIANNRLHLVIPQNRAGDLKMLFPDICFITGVGDYIDRKNYKGRKALTRRIWDEIWLLSSRPRNYLDFQDCLCIISELDYRLFFFKGAAERPFICGENGRFIKTIGLEAGFITESYYKACKLSRKIRDCMFGYRW